MTALALLPGMNCSGRLWDGCGLDDAQRLTLTESSLDEQVARTLDELAGPAVLVGLSLGAIVAMAVARTAPDRVAGLVLISSNAKAPTDAQRAAWAGQRRQLAEGVTARELQRDLLPVLLGPGAADDPDLVEATLAMADDVGSANLDAQLALQTTRIDERPGLARLTVPLLIIGGHHDALCPPAFAHEIAAAAPHARLELIDAGHLAPLERPDLVAPLLRDWLSTVPGRSSTR